MSEESKLILILLNFIPFVCSYATVFSRIILLFWFDKEKGGSLHNLFLLLHYNMSALTKNVSIFFDFLTIFVLSVTFVIAL